jgi:hypothetical protein
MDEVGSHAARVHAEIAINLDDDYSLSGICDQGQRESPKAVRGLPTYPVNCSRLKIALSNDGKQPDKSAQKGRVF